MAFQILKITGGELSGPRFLAHLPNLGFCLVARDEPDLKRLVLKFNDGKSYDQRDIDRHTAIYVNKGYSVQTMPLPSEF